MADALEKSKSVSLKKLNANRLEVLKSWVGKARSLEKEEDQIRQSLPDHAKAILAPKRIALWTHLLREYNYPDQGVVDELIGGVRLTGPVPRSAVFEHSFKPALLTEGELQKGAPASRAALIHSVRSSGDAFIDAEVYRKTQ